MSKETTKRFTVSMPAEIADGAFAKAARESRSTSNYFRILAERDLALGGVSATPKRNARRRKEVA